MSKYLFGFWKIQVNRDEQELYYYRLNMNFIRIVKRGVHSEWFGTRFHFIGLNWRVENVHRWFRFMALFQILIPFIDSNTPLLKWDYSFSLELYFYELIDKTLSLLFRAFWKNSPMLAVCASFRMAKDACRQWISPCRIMSCGWMWEDFFRSLLFKKKCNFHQISKRV